MEPPPLPSASGRFRLRVQILPPQDAYNLSAAPLRQFTIVKTAALPLPDLTLQELCDEVVTRFKAIYPGESLFAIERPQDSYGSDLYLGDRVRDIFEDNEVFRVLKGATIRASVEPHRARSQSLQPSDVVTYESVGPEKRSYGYSETEDSLHVPKRQRMAVIKPDHPLRSREPDTVEPELQKPDEQRQEATVIQDSQASTVGDSSKQAVNALNQVLSKFRQTNPIQNSERTLMNQPPPIPASTSSAPSNRIPSPPSIISWRDEVINGGSNVHPRAGTRAKRKIYQIEEFSEQDGRQSVSTAVTTPLSALQSPNAHSPANDKKLRRPTMRPTKTSAEYKNVSRILPRKNVYEDIETDLEHPGAKSTAQTVHPGLGNPGTPQGVSLFKWKRGWSKTPSSDKSSPRQQRTATFESQGERNPNESRVDHEDQQHLTQERDEGIQVVKQRAEQERLRLASEAAEKKRLEAKEAEDKLEAESEAERIVNEKLEEERQAELEKNRIAAERLRHEEEEKERVAAEKVRHQEAVKQAEAAAAAEAGAEAMRKRNSLAQAEAEMMAQLQTKAREEAKAREAAEAEGKRGNERQDMVRQEMEAIQKADEEDSLKEQALVRSRQEREHRKQELLMDTIRRGGRNGSKPGSCTPLIPRGRPSLFSPASASPSPKLPSLNVGLEAQMPLPPQIRRKVSFVDQQASSGRSSSATNTSFKQTTLVPPRIGNTGVRETPKRAQLKTYGKSSMLSKGKAKVVESPEKPAVPRREIKSDEDIIAESSGSEYLENNDQALGEPGPAYRRPMTRHTSSSSNSGVSTTPRLETARHGNSVREEAETSSSEKSKSSSPLGRNNMLVRQDKTNLIPEVHEPLARESKSTPIPLPKSRGSASKCGFSTQIRESLKKADSLTSDRSQKANIEPVDKALKNKAANEAADDTHEEPEPTKRNGDSKSQKALASSNKEQNDSPRLEIETQDEASDDSGEEVSSTEMHDNPKTANVVLAQVNKDPSNHRTQNVLDEITDEEQDEDSDGMQAEIDDQLLTQSFESTSSMKQLSIVPIKNKTPLKGNVDTNGFQNYTSGRPSLRRMNQEAQRTKQATLEAAKARGLERAQKMGNGVKRTGLLVNSEDTVSEFSSSEDDSEGETIARKTATDRTEVDRGDLDHEDAEEMGQQLIARENSGKLGWGKLGKQFGTKRYW